MALFLYGASPFSLWHLYKFSFACWRQKEIFNQAYIQKEQIFTFFNQFKNKGGGAKVILGLRKVAWADPLVITVT